MRRSAWAAPLFLVLLVGVSAALVPAFSTLTSRYADVVAALARVPRADVLGTDSTVSFHLLVAVFLALLSLFTVGTTRQRLALLAFSQILLWTSLVVVDVVLARAAWTWVPAPLSLGGGIVAGFVGLFVLIVTVFTRFELPDGVRVERRVRPPPRVPWRRAAYMCAGAVAAALAVANLREQYIENFYVRFLGGVALALLAIVCIWRALSSRDRRAVPTDGPLMSVAFLVPAFNESAGIEECIRSIDWAAWTYQGRCQVYVVDHGSVDDTRDVAKRAIESCTAVEGRLLVCPTPGKSHALNYGLEHVTEDVVVRVDADTLVSPNLLWAATPWFWDPTVGGVSGLPLPKATRLRWLAPIRLIEVYYGVAFLRVAQGAVDGVMVMPSLVACYRRDVLAKLGGFGEGFDGEDADVTMRISRLGYRIVTDPRVSVRTEVPGSLGQLREQRQRWARGLFHTAARNLSSIPMRQGPRGVWILPWSILNGTRRMVMVPALLTALAVALLDPSVFSLREVCVVAGFIIGLQALVIVVVLIANRQFAPLPWIPLYLLFRVLRAYFAFETLLTLRLKSPKRRRTRDLAEADPPPASEKQHARSHVSRRRAVGL